MTKEKRSVRVQNPSVGIDVELWPYRKVRGKGFSNKFRQRFVGEIGKIVQINPDVKDSAGCSIVCVKIVGFILEWRLANLRKIRRR